MKSNRTINNYKFSTDDYNHTDIMHFVKTKEYPKQLTPQEQRKFKNQFGDFKVIDNKLTYYDKIYIPDQDVNNILQTVYDDPIKGHGRGLNSFHAYIDNNYINISRKQSREFLKSQQSYQLTKPISKPNVHIKKASKPNSIWYMDLIDMSFQKKGNNGYRYIMSILDSHTRYLALIKLKSKSKEEVFKVITTMMIDLDIFPKQLISDQGGEFRNQLMQDFADKHNIRQSFQPSYTPQANIENVNKDVRKVLQHTFVKNKNLIWYDKLDDVADLINKHVEDTYKPPKNQKDEHKTIVHKIGDLCRVKASLFNSSIRKLNKAGYGKYVPIKWTVQIFKIKKVIRYKQANTLPRYELITEDGTNEVIDKSTDKPTRFNHTDLQFIKQSVNNKLNNSDQARLNNTKIILEDINEEETEPEHIQKQQTRTTTGVIPEYKPLPDTPKILQDKMEKISKPKAKEEIYLIDRLIGRKSKKGKIFYKVLWQDYPEDQATWEAEKSLIKDGQGDLIKEFKSSR